MRQEAQKVISFDQYKYRKMPIFFLISLKVGGGARHTNWHTHGTAATGMTGLTLDQVLVVMHIRTQVF